MEANDITLQELIYTSKQYIIPVFQRYYSWQIDDWETLWSDIDLLTEKRNQDRVHFMGSLVFFPLPLVFTKNLRFQVIDGQQRLVTFSLIFSALRHLAMLHKELDLADEILEHFLIHKFEKDEERYRIFPRQRDREEYIEALTRPNVAINGSIGEAFRFFVDKLSAFIEPDPPQRLKDFFDLLKARLEFVYIQLNSENPYEIFKSLNSKGVPLSQADLIRNFVFMHVKPKDQDAFDDQQWRPLEAHFEYQSGDSKGELNADLATSFFRDHLMKSGEYVTINTVFETFEDQVGDDFDPYALAADLHEDAAAYDIIRGETAHPNAAVDTSLSKLRKLVSSTTYPLLLALLQKADRDEMSDAQLVKAIELISGFILRRYATNQSSRTYGRWFVAACNELSEKPVENLNRFLFNKGFPTDRQFQSGFTTFPWYGGTYTRPVLEALERASEHKEPADLSKASIEHIMPQTLTDAWHAKLGANSDTIHEEWLHTIGNLTLSAYNPELFNHPFQEKRREYARSNITLNRDIAKCGKWGEGEIKDRAEKLAAIASTIWIGPDEVKTRPKPKPSPHAKGRNKAGYTPRQQLQLDFWTAYMQYIEAHDSRVNRRKPYPQHWADFAIGRWEFWLGNAIVIDEHRTDIYLGMQGPDAKRHFHELLQDKDAIELELGTKLDWQELPHRKSSYIYLSAENFDIENRDQWARQHKWMHRWLNAFYDCFHPRTQALRDPNRSRSGAGGANNPNGITLTKQLQIEFWTTFNQYLETKSSIIKGRKPRADSWASYAIGRWEFELSSSIHIEKQRTNVDLCLYGPDAKTHFHLLFAEKDAIEKELGTSVTWKELPEKKSSYITLSTTDFDPAVRETWPRQHAWMHKWLEAFYNCFHPRTQAMRDEEGTGTTDGDGRANDGLTSTQRLQLDFWTSYKQYLEGQDSDLKPRKPRPQHWYDFAIGRWEFHIGNAIIVAQKRTDVYLWLEGPDAKRHFQILFRDKDAIEAELGTKLEWNELPDKKASNIYLSTNQFDPANREQWLQQQAWMHRSLEGFYKCFRPRTEAMRDL